MTSQLMSEEQVEARAQQRAYEQGVRIRQVEGRQGVYITRSKSDPSVRYSLVAGHNGEVGCSCKGFEHRHNCKHSEQLKNRLAREHNRAFRRAVLAR